MNYWENHCFTLTHFTVAQAEIVLHGFPEDFRLSRAELQPSHRARGLGLGQAFRSACERVIGTVSTQAFVPHASLISMRPAYGKEKGGKVTDIKQDLCLFK